MGCFHTTLFMVVVVEYNLHLLYLTYMKLERITLSVTDINYGALTDVTPPCILYLNERS